MDYKFIILTLALIVLVSGFSFADITGNISLNTTNNSTVTGIRGSVATTYCDRSSDCADYSCYLDYDNSSESGKMGWCYPSSLTTCQDDGTWRANAYTACRNTTHLATCTSSAWVVTDCTASSKVCSSGACATSSTDGTTSDGTTTSTTTPSNDTSTTEQTVEASEISEGQANISISNITSGQPIIIKIDRTSQTDVLQIKITTNKNLENVKISVQKLLEKPSDVSANITTPVYKYLQINKTNITNSDLTDVIIQFEVNLSWASQNNINLSNITLLRYNETDWESLLTAKVDETNETAIYNATSPNGLSYFAITGSTLPPAPFDWIWIIIIIIIIIVIVLVILLWPSRTISSAESKRLKEPISKIKEKLKRNKKYKYSYRR